MAIIDASDIVVIDSSSQAKKVSKIRLIKECSFSSRRIRYPFFLLEGIVDSLAIASNMIV